MTGLLPDFRTFPGVEDPHRPIESAEELVGFFAAGCKAEADRRVGVEIERLPLLPDGRAAPFAGATASVSALLRFLARRLDLTPMEVGGQVLGLSGRDRAVHLEPGGQVELALGPRKSATDVAPALHEWDDALAEGGDATGVRATALGLQPFTPVPAVGWVPKARYGIMSRHLGARGRLAHHMMKATASVQVNLDYTTEAEAGDMLRTALAVAPLVNAPLANSPLEAGAPNGFLTMRPLIWAETDPERTGLLPWVFEEPWSFERWIEWALGVTVMFVVRDGAFHAIGDRSFATFLAGGAGPLGRATHADFQLHVTTLFPEARLKQHVEIRGADSVATPLAVAATALWEAILRTAEARAEAAALTSELPTAERLGLHFAVGRKGLDATLRGRPVREACGRLVDVAARHARPPARELLEPLRALVSSGREPARDVLERWRRGEALVPP